MRFLINVIVSIVLFFSPAAAFAQTPKETVQARIDEILMVLKDPALVGEEGLKEKEKMVWVILDKVFSYRDLSQQVLGRNWKEIDENQKDEFTKTFSRFLGRAYMKKVISYADEKIDVNKELMLDEETAEVRTIIHSKNTEIPVNYRLVAVEGQWKVFDVVIEGVSLVNNYRSQFKQFLRKKSIDQLIKKLQEKNEKNSE